MLLRTDPIGSDAVVRALAEPLRARIVELTGARQTNISNHLRVLREAGLVAAEPVGRYTYYRLRDEAFTVLAQHFTDLARCAGDTATIRRACP